MKRKFTLAIIILSVLILSLLEAASAATSVTLSSSGQTETTISLSWTKTNDWFFTRYDIYYAMSTNGPWTLLNSTTDADATSTYVYNLTPNTDYYFRVDDTGSGVGTSPSNTLQVKTKPTPVLDSLVNSHTLTTASLHWTCYNTYSSLVPFKNYIIQMRTAASGSWSTLTTIITASQSTYTVTGLSQGYYEFKVTDVCGTNAQFSSDSNIQSLTIPTNVDVHVSPSSTTAITGQQVQLTATASGGTGAYRIQWYLGVSAITDATSTTYTYTASSAGTFTIYATANDLLEPLLATARSNDATIVVNNPTPSPSPTPSPTPVPTVAPTNSPTNSPTTNPTISPTTQPTANPTSTPNNPTSTPTPKPTDGTTNAPFDNVMLIALIAVVVIVVVLAAVVLVLKKGKTSGK